MKIKIIKLFVLILIIQSCSITKETHKEIFAETTPADRVWGIDISHYQEIVDWDKFQHQEPGFIFLKATEGSTVQDPKYTEYYKQFRNLNIPVGYNLSYCYFGFNTSVTNYYNFGDKRYYTIPVILPSS